MPESPSPARYDWVILQEGELPLRPEGWVNPALEHRCTSALIWPEEGRPTRDNTLLTDPYFTGRGFRGVASVLKRLGLPFHEIGRMFVTHPHFDHCLELPDEVTGDGPPPFEHGAAGPLAGIRLIPCPGHEPSLHALVFRADSGDEVWIVGDAILDEPWLRAWAYYWPNRYCLPDVVETWRSVATILSRADVVVPGHGPPISITSALLQNLLSTFPAAQHAERCLEVGEAIECRLDALLDDESAEGAC